MSAWEAHLHADAPDILVQLAIAHAEFEAIHPFLDGNGRLGRLMVPLFLKSKGLLSRPNFYLSAYLERHRGEYYARLTAVSRADEWNRWLAFFLQAPLPQAAETQENDLAIPPVSARIKDLSFEAPPIHRKRGVEGTGREAR